MIPDRMGTRLGVVAVLLLLAPGLGLADQYWVAYEGNDYPENEGWYRIYSRPAERSLEDGCLVLDSRSDMMIVDFYQLTMPGLIDPDPGELFIMQWRTRIDELIGAQDPTLVINSDDGWGVGFKLTESSVRSSYYPDVQASFEPGVFHEFELRSNDMREYHLYIDGELAIEHLFREVSTTSRMAWGAGVEGAGSLSRWDYVRFGVVPEPSSFAGVSFLVALAARIERRTAA